MDHCTSHLFYNSFLGHWQNCKMSTIKSGNIAAMFATIQAASIEDGVTDTAIFD